MQRAPYFKLTLIMLCIFITVTGASRAHGSDQVRTQSAENVSPHESILLYFYTPGCPDCARVNKLLRKFQESHSHLHVHRLNILNPRAAALNKGLCMDMELPPEKHGIAPSVFGATGALINTKITPHSLLKLVEDSRGKTPTWVDSQLLESRGKKAIKRRYDNLTPFLVIGAGLADGVNPCAFAAIIFFLTYMTYVGKDRKEIVMAGLFYTAAVFITYLAIGIGLHHLISTESLATSWFRRIMYTCLIVLLLLGSALSIHDALVCRRGETEKVSLKLPAAFKRRIRLYITRRTRRGLTIAAALSLGMVVALLEFPCTGQTYIPIITYLSVRPVSAFGWLILYNLCFILPLLVVFLCVLAGTSSEQIKSLFQRHLAKTKLAMALVFLFMAAVLILTFP